MEDQKLKKKLKLDLQVLKTLNEEEASQVHGGDQKGIPPTSPAPASWPCTIPIGDLSIVF
jgi:hypothetical protein